MAILVLRALDTNRRLKSKSRGPRGRIQSWIPLYIWGMTPYILSCGVRQFLESESDISDWLELQKFIKTTLSTTTIATWFHLMLLLVLIGLLYIFVGLIVNGRYLCTFWLANYTSSRTGSRKLWRALDTCASIFTLGSFFNYVDQILTIIDPLWLTLVKRFLYCLGGSLFTINISYPPCLVNVVCERPPKGDILYPDSSHITFE